MKAAPKALHIVLNGVVEDSRVLKCAWSLGNAGWDVLICGSTPSGKVDKLSIGYAEIRRLQIKYVINQRLLAKLLRKSRQRARRIAEKFFPKLKCLNEANQN
jgi:hypothetical protein